MNKKILVLILGIIIFIIGILSLTYLLTSDKDVNSLKAIILAKDDSYITIQDKDNIIYTFKNENIFSGVGENILLEYTGILDKNMEIQNISVDNWKTIATLKDENNNSSIVQDDGMFSKYYNLAYNKVKNMELEKKISQLLLVRYPSSNQVELLKKYQFGGYLFFEKDFKDKTSEEVIEMMSVLKKNVSIPILTATDEEGGDVVRVSSNPNLRDAPFLSSSELYKEGGFELIHNDTIEKSKLLKNLGINLNLAPVVDVVTDVNAYMYDRSFKADSISTAKYAKTVIKASKDTGVSYTLKHFPGYGNNIDTHFSSSIDIRSYDDILNNDLLPFKSGIDVGAEAVLVGHNIVKSIDSKNPASLSSSIHNLLRNELGFSGIIITDDISMNSLDNIANKAVLALLAGNDLIITSDYEKDINDIKSAIDNKTLATDLIDKLATRIIAWKYYKGLMFENQK